MKNFKNKNFIYRLILSAVFLVSNFFDNEAELINAVQLTSINFCAMPLQTKELPQEKLLFQCQRQQQIYYSISPNIMEDMTKLWVPSINFLNFSYLWVKSTFLTGFAFRFLPIIWTQIMTKKNIILLILISFLLLFGVYCYCKISKEAAINIKSASISYNLNTTDLIANFKDNKKSTNEKFTGKIVKIEGKVKEISFLNNTNTVILLGDENSGIICDFNQNQTKEIKALTKNQTVIIKGIYKGFLKDVILLNCLLMNDKTNE